LKSLENKVVCPGKSWKTTVKSLYKPCILHYFTVSADFYDAIITQ